MKTIKSKKNYLIAFAILFLQFGCAKKISESITADTVPPEVDKTTILVTSFEKKDPMVYDPYYINKVKSDSVKKLKLFTFAQGTEDTMAMRDRPAKIEHPLIIETNKHLDTYNKRLVSNWKSYKYPYQLVKESEINDFGAYADKDKYRYQLIAKPVLLCYVNPDDNTILSYRYRFYFYDRKLNKAMPEIDVYSSDPLKTHAAIIYKMNHLYKG